MAAGGLVRAALLATGLAACSQPWPTPPVMDEAALVEHLLPRGEERLVLANFWATW
jgi:hypothetical protein